ncbi:MAG: ECF transporter S component [Oscillospiraceae bacterium]
MKKILSVLAAAGVAAAAVFGAVFSGGTGFWVSSAAAALLCCVPFFLSFEKRAPSAGELVLIAVMTAFSAAGRFIFAPVPFFKPVAAVVVIAARHFGGQAGFMIGALSAIISNIYFGQGPWTPFQMLCWGLIGLAAGVAGKRGLLDKPLPLCIYGVLSGVFYSLVMDVWTVLSVDGGFSGGIWAAVVISALPVTGIYCASNIIFLMILNKPLGKMLERLKTKYGVFLSEQE